MMSEAGNASGSKQRGIGLPQCQGKAQHEQCCALFVSIPGTCSTQHERGCTSFWFSNKSRVVSSKFRQVQHKNCIKIRMSTLLTPLELQSFFVEIRKYSMIGAVTPK
jgi:hypothetical protein